PMSQFGFFNSTQPLPQPARSGYDVIPASHSAFEAPRRYEDRRDDPYARAPSPRGAGFYETARAYPPGPMDRLPGSMDRAYPAPSHYAESSMPMVAPMDRGAYLPMEASRPMAAVHYETGRDPYTSVHYETGRDPYPAPVRYETGRDSFPASWRSEPPREEPRHEFFGNNDTWRSTAPRRSSPSRDRIYNSDAFGSQRDYSPPFKRPQYSKDRSPPRRENRTRDRSSFDDKHKREGRAGSNEREKERKRERSRSRDRKKDRKDEKPEKEHKRTDLNWRGKEEKENGKATKGNGEEKKRRVDDKKEEAVEESKKEEEKIEPEPEKAEETKYEPKNNDEETTDVVEEDKYEEMIEDEGKKKKAEEPEKVEPPKKEEKKEEKVEKKEGKKEKQPEKTDDRQSRIRSPSIEKRRHDRSRHRGSSAEKKRDDRPRNRSPRAEKRRDDGEFKVITDASFDEIHRPGARPYGTTYKGRGTEHRSDYRPEPPKPEPPRERGASWAEQYKAKVMMTKTAVHGLGGAPAAAAPSMVAMAPAAVLPPVASAPLPPLPRSAAYDAYDAYDPYAAARQSASISMYAERPLAEYPPRAHPTELADYARRVLASPAMRALDAMSVPRDPYDERERILLREERDLYERRRLLEERERSRSPPPRRPEMYDYERRMEERLPPPRDYYEERYRSERPDDRARYADVRDERARYAERAPYETALSGERERRPSHHEHHHHRERSPHSSPRHSSDRHRASPPSSHHYRHAASPPSPKPMIEEIDASKLVEPLEDDGGWDDVARMLSPEKVVVEKKAKKPLLAAAPPPQPVPPHRPMPRDSPPMAGGFFSQPALSSVKPKIAFHDSQPFYQRKSEMASHSSHSRPAFFDAPRADGRSSASYAPPPASDAYSRAISYEDLASSNGAATYRGGPAPGWERDSRRY
ncbi:hypothetical protein PMAYCL1PPCAC_05143, partial [Pristionchus mayeri]